MAEEHGFQPSEGHRLCANNCGFFGSPATMDLCSKCYRDLRLKEEQDAIAKAALDPKPSSSCSSSSSSSRSAVSVSTVVSPVKSPESAAAETAVQRSGEGKPNTRCMTCRKRVGLTGFKCRCGLVLCGSHRYPEEHGCWFDYKKAGKEEIAKANPVVKAEKLGKI